MTSRRRHYFKQKLCAVLIISSLFFVGVFLYAIRQNGLSAEFLFPQQRNGVGKSGTELLTMQCNLGRLGNQMCTYASLYGLCTLNKRKMQILPCNYKELKDYFDIRFLVVDMNSFEEKNPWEVHPYLHKKDLHISASTNIIKGYLYPCSYTFYNHIRGEIKELFRFKTHIQNYAAETLAKVQANITNPTFIGVHVRRTDYLGTRIENWLHAFGGNEVDLEYFEKAIAYYKNKYTNTLFVAVSDDRKWCNENLGKFGIHVTENSPSPAHDMAILANCNHTIMTYGTFGFWGGYLAGGEVVYFDKFLKPGTDFLKNEFFYDKLYLPEWVGITTSSSYAQK